MATALYSHLSNSPIVTGLEGASVCLHVIFDGVPGSDINDPGLWFDIYRAAEGVTTFPGGDGTSEAERCHIGCVSKIVDIAARRGVALDPSAVAYGGV